MDGELSVHGGGSVHAVVNSGRCSTNFHHLTGHYLVLEELTAAAIDAEITHNRMLDGSLPDNIANKTRIGGCAQLEMGTSFRSSLYGTNTRPRRKHTTNETFKRLVAALRRAISRVV